MGHPKPAAADPEGTSFTFERGAAKRGGGDFGMERILHFNGDLFVAQPPSAESFRVAQRPPADPAQPGAAVLQGKPAIGTVRYPRLVPKDAECAGKPKARTLTNLYNERPTWLDLAHKKLDAAVFAAYGWDPAMGNEEILEKLLALNLERAAAERAGP